MPVNVELERHGYTQINPTGRSKKKCHDNRSTENRRHRHHQCEIGGRCTDGSPEGHLSACPVIPYLSLERNTAAVILAERVRS